MPALDIRAIRMSERGDEHAVGVFRIDDDGGDLLSVAQAHVFPGFAAVGRFVDAIADTQVGPLQALAAADVNHIGVRRRDGERADGAGRLIVKDGGPYPAVIRGLPYSAVIDADEKDVGFAGDGRRRRRCARPDAANAAPAEPGVDASIDGLSVRGRRPGLGETAGRRANIGCAWQQPHWGVEQRMSIGSWTSRCKFSVTKTKVSYS